MSLKVILFDFSGTIINDERLNKKLIYQILLEENLRPASNEYREKGLGRSDRTCLQDALSHRGRVVSQEYIEALLRKKSLAYQQRLQRLNTLPIYPGLPEFLQQVREQNILMGIVAGASRSDVDWVLNRANLESYFSILVTGEDLLHDKPDPYSYLLALERINRQFPALQVQAANCLAIEDAPVGIEAAKRAGMQVLGMARCYPFHMIQRQAHWSVDDYGAIELERIQQVFAEGREIILQ